MSVNDLPTTGRTPYALWQSANFNKRRPSPPPPRTDDELLEDLIYLFKYSHLFDPARRNPVPHPDDISRVRGLLLKAWDEALRDDQDNQKEQAATGEKGGDLE